MQVISVNVGLPRQVHWKGRTVTTGIFKEPVAGHMRVRTLNLDGDRQADLSVHGGADKAVYAYPGEHYEHWHRELNGTDLPWGMFGENLTTAGLQEDAVNIGDRFRIGSTVMIVTQPRMPCYKLAIRFGRDDMVKRFLDSRRNGFYLAVLQEGEIGSGDSIQPIGRDETDITVADIIGLFTWDKDNLDLLHRAVRVEALAESWRSYFRKRIETLDRS